MRVALIGPPSSGKSTLFAAVAAGSGSRVDISRPDQPHLAVAKVPDERLDWLSEHYKPKKHTPAELEFLDIPGFDLSDQAGRMRAKQHWAAMRQCDMLVFVVRSFEEPTVPAYKDRIDPAGDVSDLLDEMLFADLEQVTARIEKLETAIKKPTPKRDEQKRELDLMLKIRDSLENEKPVSEVISNESDDKLVRSFAFLSQKPVLVVMNCGEDAVAGEAEQVADKETIKLSARIEGELAELSDEDSAEFMADLGIDSPAGEKMVRSCYKGLKLVSFLTAGEDECRAWTIRAGTTAVDAAHEIHSDIARGFIRAETVAFDDLKAGGDMKGAKAAGKVRLEGKTYIVQDGDIINFRFNV